MKKKSIKEDDNMTLFLENMGFITKEIKSFKLKNSYVQFVSRFLICLIVSTVFVLSFKIMFNSNTVLSLELLLYNLLLCFCSEILISLFINRKENKNA